jgi:O-acetyl-ADP-ribose deacetylase (regulator of RNase III)
MIEFVSGDILKSKAEAIAHGVAPNDHFNQGLALSLREQWPSLYKDFRHYCHTQKVSEGDLWSWKGAGGPVIFNLFTQMEAESKDGHPGSASESNVNSCLKHLAKEVKQKNLKSLALPKIATGVGGLSWDVVRPLIMKHFSELDVKVVVYEKYQKNLQATEAL